MVAVPAAHQLWMGDVDTFLCGLADEGMARSSLVHLRVVLSRTLRWAQRRDLVLRNDTAGLRRVG